MTTLKAPCPKCGGKMTDDFEGDSRIELETHNGSYFPAECYVCEECGYVELYSHWGKGEPKTVDEEDTH